MRMTLIYGRRRVGKSELVKQAIKESNFKIINYEFKQVTEANNIQIICDVVYDALNLSKLGYTKLEEIVKYNINLSRNENMFLYLIPMWMFLIS